MDAFEQFVLAGMELRGEGVDETDLAVIRAADTFYGSRMRELLAEDLSGVRAEPDLDPSRAPRS